MWFLVEEIWVGTSTTQIRSAVIYENKGLGKPLLTTIGLMIERAEKGREETENEGWCYASEEYLAESLGCSVSQVALWIKQYVKDGWLLMGQRPQQDGSPA
jgi:hypothetical protein